jgi:repressor LexA
VPVVGRVAAGAPILAVEDAQDTFPLPVEWVHDDQVFMLTVEGESMIEAGILPGDLLVVRSQQSAYNGDIVVALLGEEVTVKRFFREGGRVRLQPENSAMEPIYAKQVSILGKVIGLVRRM